MKLNTTQLRSFFYGTLLGDSYFSNGQFRCKQISYDLMKFKYDICKQYLPNAKISFQEYSERVDKNGVNHQRYWELTVSKSEYLKKLEQLFYPNGKKICPKDVINKLDWLGFAMWYADDGTTVLVQKNPNTGGSRNRRVQLCTDNFTLEEHNTIIVPELQSFGLEPKIIDRHRNNQYRIQLNNAKINQRFLIDIGQYFYNYFPSLLYKMDMGYRTKSLDKRTYVLEEYKNFYLKVSTHPLFVDRLLDK